jgi:hypothetical protein
MGRKGRRSRRVSVVVVVISIPVVPAPMARERESSSSLKRGRWSVCVRVTGTLGVPRSLAASCAVLCLVCVSAIQERSRLYSHKHGARRATVEGPRRFRIRAKIRIRVVSLLRTRGGIVLWSTLSG